MMNFFKIHFCSHFQVAIAMAINETEKNGGRVLGRTGNRANRNVRRDRIPSMEDEQRRMEPSADTFSRPTMGAVPSHQFPPPGPASMGFLPHGPSMPPFPRMPHDLYEPPPMNERGSPPPRLPPPPPRYHPGSMVFQPRSISDRFIDRPYFARPPSDLPPMYWTSPPRHALISPSDVPHLANRERFQSETSEGASSVFESREEGAHAEGPIEIGPRSGDRKVVTSSDLLAATDDMHPDRLPVSMQGRVEHDPDRLRQHPSEMSHLSEKIMVPPHVDILRRTPDGRFVHPSEHRSPRGMDERPVHILDERGRIAEERIRSSEDRARSLGESSHHLAPAHHHLDERMQRGLEERPPFSEDERFQRSPQRMAPPTSDQMLSHMNRLRDAEERSRPRLDERMLPTMGLPLSVEGRTHLRVPDGWNRYEMTEQNPSPNKYSPSGSVEPSMVNSKTGSPHSPLEKANGYRTQPDEFKMSAS